MLIFIASIKFVPWVFFFLPQIHLCSPKDCKIVLHVPHQKNPSPIEMGDETKDNSSFSCLNQHQKDEKTYKIKQKTNNVIIKLLVQQMLYQTRTVYNWRRIDHKNHIHFLVTVISDCHVTPMHRQPSICQNSHQYWFGLIQFVPKRTKRQQHLVESQRKRTNLLKVVGSPIVSLVP